MLTRCRDAIGHVEVPETALGLPVTGIDDRAFLGKEAMTSVTLPRTLREIGSNAFLGCRGLTRLILPDGVDWLGPGAFEGCERLSEVKLSGSLRALPPRAFYLCRSLRAVEIPAGVREIGESAFDGCASLSLALLPEGLEAIGPRAFAGCAGIRALRVPRSVTRMDATSLPTQLQTDGTLHLPGIGLLVRATASLRWSAPAGTRRLADGALAGNHDLTEVTLPDTVEAIGARAFDDCRCLHEIHMPEKLQALGVRAFRGCKGLRAVKLPGGLESLSDGLFEGSGLIGIALPEAVTAIGARAFADCAALESVTLNDGLRYIGPCAFARCARLKALTLPPDLEALGPQALLECRALEALTLPGRLPEGLTEAVPDLRRVAVVAPKHPPEALPPLWRKRALMGFALTDAQGVPYPPEVRAAYIRWMRAHAAALTGDAAGCAPLLRLMLDHRCLAPADARRLVDRLSQEERPELILELLNYLRSSQADQAPDALW